MEQAEVDVASKKTEVLTEQTTQLLHNEQSHHSAFKFLTEKVARMNIRLQWTKATIGPLP